MTILQTLADQKWPVLAFVLAAYLTQKVYQFYRLRHFKGPFGTGFSGIPHSIHELGPACHEWFHQVSDKYGPIARIGPNLLITSDPSVWSQVNLKAGYKRSDWYYHSFRMEHGKDNVFTDTNNDCHDARRKRLATGYSGRDNKEMEPSLDACLQEFIALLRSKYLSTENRAVKVDLAMKIQFLTLDIISSVGLGKKLGLLDADDDIDDYVKSTDQGLTANSRVAALGLGFILKLPWIGKQLVPSPNDARGFGKMMAKVNGFVDERTAPGVDNTKRSDMLSSYIRNGLRGDDLRIEALLQLIAGSDTTAGTLRATILYLISSSRVRVKLQREIDQAVRDSLAPAKGAGIISNAAAKQLPYLQAVVRESMRVWPAVTNVFPRDVPPGGDTVVGVDGKPVFLPGGAQIGYSAVAMHHDRALYGDDADVFRPERWFEADPERLAAMTRTNDLMFGYGRWHCLGMHVAKIELNKSIFEIMRNFDLDLVYPATPWKTKNAAGIFIIHDLWVQVTERAG
ncbi:cytochrome P450 [Podospora appendiculata]|uniref:Cytochrome P450 n=1 Tax=Podospora appendiculata TaxID=314037 RepID=A0AAE0XD92_9PEZI|nr:cytochrome P450 [Podospora appendiculata]